MAETTATRPSRSRAATKATPAKATAPVAEKAPEAAPTEAPTDNRITLTYVHDKDTKNYAVFTPPADSGVVGSVYAPLGTTTVKVLIVS